MSLKELWAKVPYDTKSAIHTFVSVFIGEALFQLSMGNGPIPTSRELLLTIGIPAIRAGLKAVTMGRESGHPEAQ